MRINSIPPRFMHGGLELNERWQNFDTFDDKQRDALKTYHGRFIRIHSDDVGELAKLGLAMKDEHEPLVELEPAKPEPKKPTPARSEDKKKDG